MSDHPARLVRPLALVLALLAASCKGSTEVCPPGDALCNGNGGGGTPSLSIADATVTEGHDGTVSATFTLTLSRSSTEIVTANYATSDGTATAPADYTTASGQVTVAAGTTTQTIAVSVVGDLQDEGTEETFTVSLSSATNATIGDGTATGTITDDDDCAPMGPLALGTMATGSLGPGDCQLGLQLYQDIWGLDVANETTIDLLLRSTDFDAWLQLHDATGLLEEDDDDGEGPDGHDSRIVRTLGPGSYSLNVTSFDARVLGQVVTGAYQLSADLAPVVISNPTATLVLISDPACTGGGSSVDISFDYSDATGSVTQALSFVDYSFTYLPSGDSGDFSPVITILGTPSAGTVTFRVCPLFLSDTSFDYSVVLINDVDLFSNTLDANMPRPNGAPVGTSAPGEGIRRH